MTKKRILFSSSDYFVITVDMDEISPGVDPSDAAAVLRDYDENDRGPLFDEPIGIDQFIYEEQWEV